MSLGPFDLTGGPFLTLYLFLFLATVVAGMMIPRLLRPEGRQRRVEDPDQLAWLAGGRRRFIEALIARMLAAKALAFHKPDIFSPNRREAARTPAERKVLALHPPVRLRDINTALHDYAEPVERKLEQAGLIMSRKARGNIAFWAALPYFMLFVFGATKWVIGDMRHKPIGYLTVALLFTAFFGLIRLCTVDRRTKAGLWAVADAKTGKDRLRRAPARDEMGLAVALFGTAALAGSPLADFHRLRAGSDGGSTAYASGGCNGGGGGGGCGGGGCGGCGGS